MRFQATDPSTQKPRSGLTDLGVLTVQAPGRWQDHQWAKEGPDGIYEVTVTPPGTGVYYVQWRCPSLGVRFEHVPSLVIHVVPRAQADAVKR